jgi:glycosyltransferase involved in cell wall biosynthesis
MAIVHLLVWTGVEESARRSVGERFLGHTVQVLNRREFRESGWQGQIKALRKLRGHALVYYFQSLSDVREPLLLAWTGIAHHCDMTVFLDSAGKMDVYKQTDLFRLFPATVIGAAADMATLLFSWLALAFLSWKAKPQPLVGRELFDLDMVYLQPDPFRAFDEGGAKTHTYGFLEGLATHTSAAIIISATKFENSPFPVERVASKIKHFVFKQALVLRLTWSFAREARRILGSRKTRCIYQRHASFRIDGALLSSWLKVPLVLEYNGSEVWLARYWDPTRFLSWLKLSEDLALRMAARIVVISEPLRQELLGRGVPDERILVNPNGVDPSKFRPNCGGEGIRKDLGLGPDDIVVGFLGSFSYWHGISVIERAISMLFAEDDEKQSASSIRFLLIGDGPLRADIQANLRAHTLSGRTVFTGVVPHDVVPSYLDAADILCSPHVPMTDGSTFFGSPTKLFEYMSAGKAIVASDLAQLSEVLRHEETALLFKPGEPSQLVHAILRLSSDAEMRKRLGRNARQEAMSKHTWSQNANRALRSVKSDQAFLGQSRKVSRPISAEQA